MTSRTIFTKYSPWAVEDLLQTIFAAELIVPSRCLWIASPWVTDIPVLDNRTGAFSTLEPSWPNTRIRLSDFLLRQASVGSTIRVATRDDGKSLRFQEVLRARGAESRVSVSLDRVLHHKGILGDSFFLAGSMNFTNNGVSVNEENVTYTVDEDQVATARINFRDRWGGEIE